MFEELNAHRQAVQENIEKAFEVGFTGNEDLEKAHQVGDIHPNGKWVWTEYKPGKFDWRPPKKRGGADETSERSDASAKKEEDESGKKKLLERKDALDIEIKKLNNQIIVNGGSVRKVLQDKKKRLESEREDIAKRISKMSSDSQASSSSSKQAVDVKVKPSSKKNPSELETISEVEDYAKSISGVTFKSVKSGWNDKGAKAFELTYPHGGKLVIDFLNNEEYVYELTDSNDKSIISTNSTNETSHTDWSIRLNPDKLVSQRVEVLKTKLTKLKGEETKARNKMIRNYSSFSDKYTYQKASEAVSDMKTKIQELQSLIGTF